MKRAAIYGVVLLASITALATPLEEHEAKCRRGEALWCRVAGTQYEEQGRYDRAQQMLEIGCRNESSSCFSLMAFAGRLVDAGQADKAFPIYTSRCENAQDATACVGAAKLQRDGKGVAADPAKAVALLERVCRTGDWRACEALKATFSEGLGVPKDPRRVAAYEKLQNEANAKRAETLRTKKEAAFNALSDAEVTATETKCVRPVQTCAAAPKASGDLLVKCVANQKHSACMYAAQVFAIRDPKRVATVFRSFCEIGLRPKPPELCSEFARGILYEMDSQKRTGTSELAVDLCDMGIAGVCGLLASWLEKDPAEQNRVKSLHRRACTGGERSSCETLTKLLDKGSPADRREATTIRAELAAAARRDADQEAARKAADEAQKIQQAELDRTLAPRREALKERRRELEQRKRAWEVEKKRRETVRERGELMGEEEEP